MRGSPFETDDVAVLDPPDGVNLYRYCGNDPINRADPSGLIDFSVETADFVSRMPEGVWEQFVRRHGLPAVEKLNQAHADGWRFGFQEELWNTYEVDRTTRTVSIDLDNGVFFDAAADPQEMADAINAVLHEQDNDGRTTLRPPLTGQNGSTNGDIGTAWDENVSQHQALAMGAAKSLDFLYEVRNELALAAVSGGIGRLAKTDDLIEAGNRARRARNAAESVLTSIEDFKVGRTFNNDVEADKAWEVYQRASKAEKGIVIGHGDDAIQHAYRGWQAFRMLENGPSARRMNAIVWTENINMAWIDGAVDAGKPVRLTTPFNQVRRGTVTWREIQRVISRGGTLVVE